MLVMLRYVVSDYIEAKDAPDLQRPPGRSLGPWRGDSPLLWPPQGAWPDPSPRARPNSGT